MFRSEGRGERVYNGDNLARVLGDPRTFNNTASSIEAIQKHVGRNAGPNVGDWTVVEQFMGRVKQTSNQPLYPNDPRYEILRVRLSGDWDLNDYMDPDDIEEAMDGMIDEDDDDPRHTIIATNLVETAYSTHLIPIDTLVHVFGVLVEKESPLVHYFFVQPLPFLGSAVVSVTGNAAGGGKYTGKIITPPSTATSAGNLSMTEGMAVGDDVLILNLPEDGSPSHALTSPSYHIAIIVGLQAMGTWIAMMDFSTTGCSGLVDTFTAVTNTAYSAGSFTQTKTEFTVDFCAGTISPDAGTTTTVFETDECPDDPSPSPGERIFSADRSISADEYYQVAGFVKIIDGVELTIADGAELLIT